MPYRGILRSQDRKLGAVSAEQLDVLLLQCRRSGDKRLLCLVDQIVFEVSKLLMSIILPIALGRAHPERAVDPAGLDGRGHIAQECQCLSAASIEVDRGWNPLEKSDLAWMKESRASCDLRVDEASSQPTAAECCLLEALCSAAAWARAQRIAIGMQKGPCDVVELQPPWVRAVFWPGVRCQLNCGQLQVGLFSLCPDAPSRHDVPDACNAGFSWPLQGDALPLLGQENSPPEFPLDYLPPHSLGKLLESLLNCRIRACSGDALKDGRLALGLEDYPESMPKGLRPSIFEPLSHALRRVGLAWESHQGDHLHRWQGHVYAPCRCRLRNIQLQDLPVSIGLQVVAGQCVVVHAHCW